MGIKFQILVFLFFALSLSVFSQWELRVNGLPEWGIADVLQVSEDSTIGIFVGTSFLPRPISISNDLANSWTNHNTPDLLDGSDATILDKNNIWFCTGDGKIYYSNDEGLNWILQFEDTVNYPFLNFIKFFDCNNGIVVGDALSSATPALILRTTDGGNNWLSINNDYLIGEFSRDVFYPINFPSISVGYFYGSRNDKLFKTNDGGTSWQIVPLPDGIYKAYMIKFYNESIGMLISDIHSGVDSIYRTINGGNSWTKLSILTNNNHHDIEFLQSSSSNVWFTDYDNLLFSDDTGNTWQEVTIVSGSLEARNIEFLNDSIGFILCDNGKFFVTENNSGIITLIDNKIIRKVNDYQLFQNYPNPFNPTTKIPFELLVKGSVKLSVYNILGEEIGVLLNEEKEVGHHLIDFNAIDLPSGVYFYKITAGNYIAIKKMLLLK